MDYCESSDYLSVDPHPSWSERDERGCKSTFLDLNLENCFGLSDLDFFDFFPEQVKHIWYLLKEHSYFCKLKALA